MDDVPLSDKEARQRIADLLWISRKFKQTFEQTVTQGYLAKEELDNITSGRQTPIGELIYER